MWWNPSGDERGNPGRISGLVCLNKIAAFDTYCTTRGVTFNNISGRTELKNVHHTDLNEFGES